MSLPVDWVHINIRQVGNSNKKMQQLYIEWPSFFLLEDSINKMKGWSFEPAGGRWKSPALRLFQLSLIWSSIFHDMFSQGGRAVLLQQCSPSSLRASPPAPRGSWKKESFIQEHLDLCGGTRSSR